MSMENAEFNVHKRKILSDINNGNDFSPKGSIDKPIIDLITLINNLDDFATTSSCSGRISVYHHQAVEVNKGVVWLAVEHGEIRLSDVQRVCQLQRETSTTVYVKCEPLILHITCRNVECARWLHQIALRCGYRESGITLGKKSIMLAIRTTAFSIEFPFSIGNDYLISENSLQIMLEECNNRLSQNFHRIDNLLTVLKNETKWPFFSLSSPSLPINPDNSFLLHRWGHTCISLDTLHTLVVGGYGLNRLSKHSRSLPSFLISASLSSAKDNHLTKSAIDKLQISELPGYLIDPTVHAAGAVWRGGAVVFGGRTSPRNPSNSLRVLLPTVSPPASSLAGWETYEVAFADGDCVPAPRWGHSLTALSSDAFLLVGGRDLTQIFADSFVLSFVSVDSQEGGLKGGRWTWRLTCDHLIPTSPYESPLNPPPNDRPVATPQQTGPSGRFFHSSCDVQLGEGRVGVLVTGGLASLTDPLLPHPVLRTDVGAQPCLWLWYPDHPPNSRADLVVTGRWHRLVVGDGHGSSSEVAAGLEAVASGHMNSLDPEDGASTHLKSTDNHVDTDKRPHTQSDCVHYLNTVFGHTLTNIGGKTLLVTGGTQFISREDSQTKSQSFLGLAIHFTGWDSRPGRNPDEIETTSLVAREDRRKITDCVSITAEFVSLSDKGNPRCLSTGDKNEIECVDRNRGMPCANCRVHHQAVRTPSGLVLVGGGGICMAFGPHYCASVELSVGTSCSYPPQYSQDALAHSRRTQRQSRDNESRNRFDLSGSSTEHRQNGNGKGASKTFQFWNEKEISYSRSDDKIVGSDIDASPVLYISKRHVKSVKTFLERQRGSPLGETNQSSQSESTSSSSSSQRWRDGWLDKTRRISEVSSSPQSAENQAVTASEGTQSTERTGETQIFLIDFSYLKDGTNATSLTSSSVGEDLVSADDMAVPICDELAHALVDTKLPDKHIQQLHNAIGNQGKLLLGYQRCRLNRSLEINRQLKAKQIVVQKAYAAGITLSVSTLEQLPRHWETVGDVLLLPRNAMVGSDWSWVQADLWRELAECCSATRVARYAAVESSTKRESQIRLIYPPLGRPEVTGPGSLGWVCVVENGIKFHFDITRVMFCSGNNTERMRMGRLNLRQKVIVDLYCGIGYYTLPFLIHGEALKVYAFEWNENSLMALKYNLDMARVNSDRYEIIEGDNRISAKSDRFQGIADRVCLGLLPSSEDGWPLAARCLKSSGGFIHVHMNINQGDDETWQLHVCERFEEHFLSQGKPMKVICAHLEKVKSYAPLVYHVVADLECQPV